MPAGLPNIDFGKIRACGGTQHGGFEELCVSLFRAEVEPSVPIQRVEGSGGDEGVEAFATVGSGDIVGLQAKFFSRLTAKQWKQIEASIKKAADSHASLKRYYVAVPLDRNPATLKRWAAIEHKWRPGLELIWWGRSELLHRLSQASHHGRLRYWFGAAQFDAGWMSKQNATAISDLDTRYTPARHIRTESENLLDAAAMADSFIGLYTRRIRVLTQSATNLSAGQFQSLPKDISTAAQQLEEQITAQLPALGRGMNLPRMTVVQEICSLWRDAAGQLWSLIDQPTSSGTQDGGPDSPKSTRDQYSYQRELVRRFYSEVETVSNFAARFDCADSNKIAVLGPVGAGKSHVLANLALSAQARNQPALLLLGEYFLSSQEPWRQLAERLGWDSDISDLLAALHYAAEIAGRPALLCIDALNESTDRRLWKSHLQAFAARLDEYPNIRLITSCRDDFASLTLPTAISERRDSSWSIIDHEGFGENIFEAVASYFSGYRVQSRHFPPLLTEFRNPLFLKTFCEAFENSSLPDGPITLSIVMETRIQRTCDRLVHDIDCPEDTSRQAIGVVAEMIEKAAGQPVPRPEIRSAIDALFPGRGESCSLYRHLRSNGLLVEVAHVGSTPGSRSIAVRFPFERFSEYFIADRMLRQYPDFESLKNAWSSDGTLTRFKENHGYGRLRGLARAMAILMPERFSREFIALFSNGGSSRPLQEDFLASLPWRSPQSFTRESDNLLESSRRNGAGDFLNALLVTATIPGHPFNANFLHERLKRMKLPERELAWTIPIGRESIRGASHGAALIVRWAFRVPLHLVSDEQATLVARVLIWLCSGNHRALRFRATLATIRLLAGRARIASQLVRDMEDVDDPYVVERVFAVAAGVAMREPDVEGLRLLAAVVFPVLFDHDEVRPNILVRDFGRCVMEIAEQRGVLPGGASPKRFRPRYRSTWPRIWSEARVKPIEKDEGWSAVKHSVQPEATGFYGDFGRYTMQAAVSNFSGIRFPSRKKPKRDTRPFDSMIARRWVIQRVAELGWTPERFGKYDRGETLGLGRQNVDTERWRLERIGKKYQWIALHELLGYLSDHYRMSAEWNDEETIFAGPWQCWARDFDPSQPLRDLEDPDAEQIESLPEPSLWWRDVYPDPFADPALCADPNAWVRQSPSDFDPLLEWRDTPNASGEFLVLGGFYMWYEPLPLGSLRPRPGKLKVWCNPRAWLVRQENFAETLEAVRQIQFWGEGCDSVDLDHRWIGTYPWGEEFAGLRECCAEVDRWVRDDKIPIEQSAVRWSEDDLSGFLPAPRLLEILGAHWSGYDFDFVDASGSLIAFSPYTGRSGGSGPLFVQKAALLSALRATGWNIIWALVGDRSCMERSVGVTHVTDGETRFSAVYWLESEKLSGGLTRTDFITYPVRSDRDELLSKLIARDR